MRNAEVPTTEEQKAGVFQIGGERYIETRLNLLDVAITKMENTLRERIDKLETAVRERIDAVEATGVMRGGHLATEIAHAKQMLSTAQETATRGSDKAEKTQHDINVASNEWRSTLNDFRSTVPSKAEIDRFYSEFTAYKMEMTKYVAVQLGERTGNKETKDDSKGMWAMAISIASALALIYSLFLRPTHDAAAPQVVYVPAPPNTLIPSSPVQSK